MSNYITINLKKISTKKEFENITKHNERTQEYLSKEERVNIDSTRTHKNIVLTKNNYSSYEDFLEQKKEAIKQGNLENGTKHRNIKEGSATQLNLVIQASKEAMNEEQHIQFLKECHAALKKHFPKNEIIEAHIHMDETTPHMHFSLAFWDQELKKFNQKQLMELQKTRLDEIFKTLEPTYRKFDLIKFLTMDQKIELLSQEQQNTLNSILEKLTTKREITQAQKKFLKSIEKYGGEAYTLPTILKSEENKITKKLEKTLKEDLEKIEKIDTKDTKNNLEALKAWNSEIDTIKSGFLGFGGEKKEIVKMDKHQFDNFIKFHEKMAEKYSQIEEQNKTLQETKTLLNQFGIKDLVNIKTLLANQKQLEDIKNQIMENEKIKKEQEQNIAQSQLKIIRNGNVITQQEQNINTNTLKISTQNNTLTNLTNLESGALEYVKQQKEKEENEKQQRANQEALEKNMKEVIEKIKTGTSFLFEFNEIVRGNKEIVLEAVKFDGKNLEYASNELKKDLEICVISFKSNNMNLRFVDPEIREKVQKIAQEQLKKETTLETPKINDIKGVR